MGSIWSSAVRFVVAGSIVFAAVGCGDDDDPGVAATDAAADGAAADAAAEEFNEAIADAMGAGGGGELTWDGTDHPIESVVCQLDQDRVDVGTVGDGFRILISGDEPYNLQILDQDSVQWYGERSEDGVRAGIERSDGTFTGDGTFFRVDDTSVTREATFVVECP